MELWGDSLLLVMSPMPSYCRSRCNFLTQQQTMPTSQILGSSQPPTSLSLVRHTSTGPSPKADGRHIHVCTVYWQHMLTTVHVDVYNCTCMYTVYWQLGRLLYCMIASLSTVYWWHTLACTIVTVHVCTQFTDNTYLHDVQVLVDHIQHYHEGVTHLLIEGGGEEGDHVCQSLEEGWSQVAVVSEHH